MKKKTIIGAALSLVLIVVFVAPALAQKGPKDKFEFSKLNPPKTPPVKQVTLKNGIKLFLIEDHTFPTIDMQGILYTGSVFEPADKAGLAYLTGTVLRTGGTKTMKGDEIDRKLETIAASIETDIGDDTGTVTVSMLKENVDKVLPILSDILRNPVFDKEKIDLAKIEIRTIISRRNDNVRQITNREFRKLIYGKDSPYTIQPEYATIDAISRDDMIAFYRKYFNPNNLWLAVWGDFKTDQMARKIQAALGSWPAADLKLAGLPAVKYDYKNTVNYIEKTDLNQSNIMMGHIGGLMNNPDYPALTVMNRILSFDRMFKTVRTDEGLAYSVWGFYGAGFKVPGVFSAGVQTKSASTVKAIQIMLREMKRITREEVSDEELKRAKDEYINSYIFEFDSRAKIINRMLTYAFYGYPLNFSEQLKKNIEKVTKADVLRVAQKYLKPDQVQILVVGKKDDFDKPLSELGKVNLIDIAIPVSKAEKAPEATAEALKKGQELFAKSVTAMGDPAKVKAIKNIQIKMDMVQTTPMGEMKMDAEVTTLYPDKVNMALNTPQGKISMIINGAKGVVKLPQGSMPLPDDQRKQILESTLRSAIYIWQNLNQFKIQYLGNKKVNDKDVIDLILSGPIDAFHIYLDPETMLAAGSSFQSITQEGPAMVDSIASDYRVVEGIKMPFKSEMFASGKKIGEQAVKEIKLNVVLSEDLFKIE